jgi:hypothetical protein
MKIRLKGGFFEFTVKPVVGITIIFSFFVFLLFSHHLFSGNCSVEKMLKGREIIGKVEERYYDLKNHGSGTIVYSEKGKLEKVLFYSQSERIYHFLMVGDSLYKPAGSLDITIIRSGKDTVFRIDFGCDKY